MNQLLHRLLFVLWLLAPSSAFAAELVESYFIVPEDKVIASNGNVDEGKFQIGFTINTDEFTFPGTYYVTGNEGTITAPVSEQVTTITVSGDFTAADLEGQDPGVMQLKLVDVTDAEQVITIEVWVDAQAPAAPTGLHAEGANGTVSLRWDEPADGYDEPTELDDNIESYELFFAQHDFASQVVTESTDDGSTGVLAGSNLVDLASAGSVTRYAFEADYSHGVSVSGLDNGAEYYFTILAIDHAGNRSAVETDPDTGEVVLASANPTTYLTIMDLAGFDEKCVASVLAGGESGLLKPYRVFRDKVLRYLPGGQRFTAWYYSQSPGWIEFLREHGTIANISQGLLYAGALLLYVLPFLVLFFVWRTCQALVRPMAMLVLCLVLMPVDVFARPIEEGRVRPSEEIHRFNQFSRVSLGGFRPTIQVSSGAAVATYSYLYGRPRRIMTRVTYGIEFVRSIGVLSAGITAGFWTRNGRSIRPSDGIVSAEKDSRLLLLPVDLGLGYAFQYVFPQYLVPAVEAGVSAWGAVNFTPGDGKNTKGIVLGWYWLAELRIGLDWMDQANDLSIFDNFGVHDTWLAVGYREDKGDDFGARRDFRLTDGMVYGALLFTF